MRTQPDLFGGEELPRIPKPPKEAVEMWLLVIGRLWMPGDDDRGAMARYLQQHEADAILAIAREGGTLRAAALQWFEPQSHDFREVIDIAVKIGPHECDWLTPENADAFEAIMSPDLDDCSRCAANLQGEVCAHPAMLDAYPHLGKAIIGYPERPDWCPGFISPDEESPDAA